MAIQLISFKLCPFVQRAVISLRACEIPYDIRFIELSDPPEWFTAISPRGKVPLLQVDGEVLFESLAIVEYINDISGGQLLPENPIERAQQRAWIGFADTINKQAYQLMYANDELEYDGVIADMQGTLTLLNQQVDPSPLYAGEQIQLIDSCFAPAFMRLALLNQWSKKDALSGFDKVIAWSSALLDHPAVKQSVVDDFDDLFLSYCETHSPYILSLMD